MTRLGDRSAIQIGLAIGMGAAQVGCANATWSVSTPKTSQVQLEIATSDQLKPNATPYPTADLVMGGTRIPVRVETHTKGSSFEILLSAHNKTFEREVYNFLPTQFSLTEGGGDSYSPPLDILDFPMQIGATSAWTGTISSGGVRRRASAKIGSSRTSLYESGEPVEAVRVSVEIALYSDSSDLPVERKLIFEFVPGKGMVRRQFGDASIREPSQK